MHANGDYVAAAEELDASTDLYGEKERTLWDLERGAVALALDDPDGTIQALSHAEDLIEVTLGHSLGDEAARWLLNDRVLPYLPSAYEDQYVNVLKLLAQLERGEISGGATVEARRMATKANVLRDRYLDARRVIVDEGLDEATGLLEQREAVSGTTRGEFVESPLGLYLSAFSFMHAGDVDDQGVAARRLESVIVAQGPLVGDIDERDFAHVGELRPDDANVLFVALSGRGPTKEAERVGPLIIYEVSVYFEVPILRGGSGEVAAARGVVYEIGPEGGPGAEVLRVDLDLIEDLRSVAIANHERQLPLIYARTLIRAGAKAAGAYALTQVAKENSSGDTETALQIGSVIGGLIYQMATERADLRSWTFLPGKAHVGTGRLDPGRYLMRIEYGADVGTGLGEVYASPWREIEIPDGASAPATLVEHYWR